ncbi:MAG: hypothetical protein AAGF74_02365 [Pseudomonadota bacterium]
MENPKRAYAIGASSVLFSRATSILSGVLSLWLLARILTTEDFAGYAVALSVVVMTGYICGLGIERAMILRLAALPPKKNLFVGRRMMQRVLGIAAVLSCVGLVAVVLITSRTGDDQAANAKWIFWLTPVVPATAVSLVLITWHQANHKVGASQMMQGLNDGTRCLLFGLIFLAGFGAWSVATAAIIAAFLPFLVLSLLSRGRSEGPPDEFAAGDLLAGLQFLVLRVSQMGLNQFDIIAMGFLSTSLETAQYAVASRVAAISNVGQLSFMHTYAPRVRRHLASGDDEAIAREYHVTRVLSFSMTLGLALAFYLFGRFALGLFGDFTGGYGPLLILIAGHLITASLGVQFMHMSMTDNLRISVVLRGLGLAIFIVALVLLVPGYGGIGAGLAYVSASVFMGLTGSIALRLRGGPPTLTPVFSTAAAVAAAGLVATALVPSLWIAGLLALTVAVALVAITERTLLQSVSGEVLEAARGLVRAR